MASATSFSASVFKAKVFPRSKRIPEETKDDQANGPKPETFDFLGFTHYWSKSRKGRWVIRRKTLRKRFTRGLKAISQGCRENPHEPLLKQVEKLGRKLKGHFGYYGITGNFASLQRYRWEVIKIWRKWLARRGDPQGMSWERMNRLLDLFYLPAAGWCTQSLQRNHDTEEPYAGNSLVRVCGGVGG